MSGFQINAKKYHNIEVRREVFTKKAILYANPTEDVKAISITIDSPFVKLKHSAIMINPYETSRIQLRIFMDRTAAQLQPVTIDVRDGVYIEKLIVMFKVI